MTRQELSRVSRQTPQKNGKKWISGSVIVLSTVLLINLVAVSLLIYLSLAEQGSYAKQGEKIATIEKQLKELRTLPIERETSTIPPVEVTGDSKTPPTKTGGSSSLINGEQDTTTSSKLTTGEQSTTKTHVVVSGDTLSVIATTENISLEDLRRLNNLSDDVLQVGQKLILE